MTGEYEVFVGLEVEDLEDVSAEMTVKVLSAVSYTVFTLRGEQITSEELLVGVGHHLPQGKTCPNRRRALKSAVSRAGTITLKET